jgi:hypothetical protein
MDFHILGPLEALDEGRAVALGGNKQRALLAVLLLHANKTLSTDRLIDELWGGAPARHRGEDGAGSYLPAAQGARGGGGQRLAR